MRAGSLDAHRFTGEMKIAFATSDLDLVDEQFRRGSYLVIYEVTADANILDRVFARLAAVLSGIGAASKPAQASQAHPLR